MLIRFIVDSSDFLKVLSGRENEDFIVLRRDNGFFKNREAIRAHCIKDTYEDDDIIIYTDDETILNYAPYVSGDYLIEFKFPESDKFISIMKLHPSLRKENDLTKMFQTGIFRDDFNLWYRVFA